MTESNQPIVLASTSATRIALLRSAGLVFTAVAPEVDEDAIKHLAADPASDIAPDDVAVLLAQTKAVTVSQRYPDTVVIGADQTLLHGERLFDKPPDAAAAREQLLALRGATHSLETAVACAVNGATEWSHTQRAHLTMRAFSGQALGRYLAAAGDEVTASVGGYRIEGPAIQLFERIEGDYFAILGLPLLPLLHFLRDRGAIST